MIMVDLLAALCAGSALGLFGVLALRGAAARPADARIRELAAPNVPVGTHRALSSREVMRRPSSVVPFLREALESSERAARWEREIEQAGLKLRVGEYVLGRALVALAAAFVVLAIGRSGAALVVALPAAGIAFMLPAYWLRHLGGRRTGQVSKQLPEAVTLIASAMKAGFAFQYGIGMVAEQMEPPTSEEFARVMADLNVGASVEEALYAMLARVDSEDMNLVVTAVLIQRQSGGNLAEILETVGETMRERERLTGEVKTMTAQQRFSGTVLTLWPVAILALFSLVNWHQTKLLFTTNIGLVLISAAAVGQLLGYYTIRRILDIDI